MADSICYLFDTDFSFIGAKEDWTPDAYLGRWVCEFSYFKSETSWFEARWNPHARSSKWTRIESWEDVPEKLKAAALLLKD